VVEARSGVVDEMAAGRGHGDSLAPCDRVVCQRIARQRVGELLFDACPGLRGFSGLRALGSGLVLTDGHRGQALVLPQSTCPMLRWVELPDQNGAARLSAICGKRRPIPGRYRPHLELDANVLAQREQLSWFDALIVADQLLPSHTATAFAAAPPAVLKLPPANNKPLSGSHTNAMTTLLVPPPTLAHVLPSHWTRLGGSGLCGHSELTSRERLRTVPVLFCRRAEKSDCPRLRPRLRLASGNWTPDRCATRNRGDVRDNALIAPICH
jgi:hypothetical protein